MSGRSTLPMSHQLLPSLKIHPQARPLQQWLDDLFHPQHGAVPESTASWLRLHAQLEKDFITGSIKKSNDVCY